jgi:hypothetical protein
MAKGFWRRRGGRKGTVEGSTYTDARMKKRGLQELEGSRQLTQRKGTAVKKELAEKHYRSIDGRQSQQVQQVELTQGVGR